MKTALVPSPTHTLTWSYTQTESIETAFGLIFSLYIALIASNTSSVNRIIMAN